MADRSDENQKPNIQANDNSVAVGNVSVGGSIEGNLTIGNTYNYSTSEDDAPISSEELEIGLTHFAEYLPERAPILQEKFASIAKKMHATLGAELNALSPTLKTQREDTVNQLKLMCMEVTDISFRALCTGQNPPPYDSRPPFLGMVAFKPKDKEFYFGRDALIQRLVTKIKAHSFLTVMGASGSGKSSLVMAGLIPALEAQMAYLTPSDAPLARLRAAQENADKDSVYVVDQLEELFTLTLDVDAREGFIKELLELTKTNRVVITMRADFWGEVAAYQDLKQAMQDHQELIAPMNTDELHSAMEQQAAAVGLRFDSALSESILEEVKGAPGAMPLLQHALWMLWKRRHGLWLKAAEYRAFGGVNQAIANTAEEVYASCPDFERDRIQNIFLRLTRLDDSGAGRDTRRRVLIEDLFPANSDSLATTQLLNKLADARLIVKTNKEVEVAHEALIRHWSRLTHWLNDDRDNLRLREGVSEDAREWEKSNHDESLLNHRGGRLELALVMSQNPRYQLNPIEQAYLNACVNVRERARIEKEQQQQRELEAAKVQADAEKRARQRTLGFLAIALVLVGVLAFDPLRNEWLKQRAMGPALISIPASEVVLGDDQPTGDPLSFLPREVYSIEAFEIEPYEVTNQRYLLCINSGNCAVPNADPSLYLDDEKAQLPVVNITAIQASVFCKWLGRDLPNDLQWERAARYLDERAWPWAGGNNPSTELANLYFESEASALRPVGEYNRGMSQEGVHDLAGNVWEWTRSAYIAYLDELRINQLSISVDTNENNSNNIPPVLSIRGGSYETNPESAMSNTIAFRLPSKPWVANNLIGFRCVSR